MFVEIFCWRRNMKRCHYILRLCLRFHSLASVPTTVYSSSTPTSAKNQRIVKKKTYLKTNPFLISMFIDLAVHFWIPSWGYTTGSHGATFLRLFRFIFGFYVPIPSFLVLRLSWSMCFLFFTILKAAVSIIYNSTIVNTSYSLPYNGWWQQKPLNEFIWLSRSVFPFEQNLMVFCSFSSWTWQDYKIFFY